MKLLRDHSRIQLKFDRRNRNCKYCFMCEKTFSFQFLSYREGKPRSRNRAPDVNSFNALLRQFASSSTYYLILNRPIVTNPSWKSRALGLNRSRRSLAAILILYNVKGSEIRF